MRVASAVVLFAASSASAQYLGPTPYTSAADSPFAGGTFGYFHLETLEDGALNTPGVAASAGVVVGPGDQTDSVDADDGLINGFGNVAHSWYSAGGVRAFRFTFDAAVLGGLPTHAGVVWTDVGTTDTTFGISDVVFTAFDAGGASLGVFGPFTLGDGSVVGQTAEDRFLGVINAGGISAIEIAMPGSGDWEVDHLQYGLVPAPGTGIVLVLAAGALCRRRR